MKVFVLLVAGLAITANSEWLLPATLTLSATGPKKEHIDVVYDHEGQERTKVLWVEAIGRRRPTI